MLIVCMLTDYAFGQLSSGHKTGKEESQGIIFSAYQTTSAFVCFSGARLRINGLVIVAGPKGQAGFFSAYS